MYTSKGGEFRSTANSISSIIKRIVINGIKAIYRIWGFLRRDTIEQFHDIYATTGRRTNGAIVTGSVAKNASDMTAHAHTRAHIQTHTHTAIKWQSQLPATVDHIHLHSIFRRSWEIWGPR